jgi:hypothetical protein
MLRVQDLRHNAGGDVVSAEKQPIKPSSVFDANIFDPRVYNAFFYSGTYPDLPHDETQIAAHWQNNGLAEGRQGCGAFHVKQYLDRYADVNTACAGDHACALSHYLTTGFAEQRLGVAADGDPYLRWTLADAQQGLYVSGGARTAGAIDSVVWDSVEFINAADHGRELQTAVTFDGQGECYNPTEAGSSNDGRGTFFSSTSQRLSASSNGNAALETSVNPAFWLAPGEKEPTPSAGCTVAINTQLASTYTITKSVTFVPGVAGALLYNFTVVIADAVSSMLQVEAPTAYLTSEFTSFYAADVSSGALTPLDPSAFNPCSGVAASQPLVLSRPDGSAAMGACTAPPEDANTKLVYFGCNFAKLTPFDNGTTKWSIIVQRFAPSAAGYVFAMASYVCVGSLSDVAACLTKVPCK